MEDTKAKISGWSREYNEQHSQTQATVGVSVSLSEKRAVTKHSLMLRAQVQDKKVFHGLQSWSRAIDIVVNSCI